MWQTDRYYNYSVTIQIFYWSFDFDSDFDFHSLIYFDFDFDSNIGDRFISLIFYPFRILLNEANECSHASEDMCSTMI